LKARELAERLMQEPEAEVVVTWEGCFWEYTVYAGRPGVLVIDADRDNYREYFEGSAGGHLDAERPAE
jgi:hypothetical protein